jgi:diguanylate cyclase (GGDEF)-like protein
MSGGIGAVPTPILQSGDSFADILGMNARSGTDATVERISMPRYVRGVRQGGMFFLILGGAGISGYLIPGGKGYHHTGLLLILPLVLLAGALARTRIAFRLSGFRSLIIPLVGLFSVAACNTAGLLSPVPLGVYFIVVFLWIGQWHPPGTALRFTPVAVAAYLVPYAIGAPKDDSTVASVVLVIAASIMVAEVVARQTTNAVKASARQADALDALSRASVTDELTGLGNRRLGNRLLDELREGDVTILLDVDRFKAINDTFGHSRGDRLLQDLGTFLLREVRESDSVARMGGEEFMVVLKGAPVEQALAVATRLVDSWRRTAPLATISAGVAVHEHGRGPSDTYATADRALYEAKEAGRDQVVLAAQGSAMTEIEGPGYVARSPLDKALQLLLIAGELQAANGREEAESIRSGATALMQRLNILPGAHFGTASSKTD